MKELFQRIKIDVIISAIVCIVFGIVLILWPVTVTTVTCKAIGAIIAILGAARIVSYVTGSREKHNIHLPLGMVLLIVGIWIFLKPESIQNLLLIGIGVVLFVHGLEDFKYAVEGKNNGYDSWWIILILAAADMCLGIACIADCFGVISVVLTFVGVALIYDGIKDLWIISRLVKIAKTVKKETEDFSAVEAEAWEIEEESEMRQE